ncbi:MAG: sodium/glutamate symporter [Paracoccaceae bacterium]
MPVVQVEAFLSFTIAVVLLIAGKILTMVLPPLRRYSIPEAVAGGLLCALVVAAIRWVGLAEIGFHLDARDFLLLVFFASIGLKADVRSLLRGGWPLAVLTGLSTLFILMQNGVGMALATAFGMDHRAGLMIGSISLTGGLGTTVAWAPHFTQALGIGNALELGIAANTAGIISACLIGGPLAAFLMRRGRVAPSGKAELDVGVIHGRDVPPLDYFCFLWGIFALNLTIMVGLALDEAIALTGFTLPAFVSCLLTGIAIGNLRPAALDRAITRRWPGANEALSVLSDLALGLFLVMALMGLQLWELGGVLGFILTGMGVQIAMTLAFAIWVVFPAMGRDYDAAVISAGFCGISLGTTATAVANMTAVTKEFGAAHRAFVIVPLVGGFFIDLANALILSVLAG